MPTRRDLHALGRQCVLALGAFLVAAVPFHYFLAERYADLVIGGARAATALVGPRHVIVPTPHGRVTVDREGAIDQFFRDLEQRPHPYGVLVFWSWIAVAPLHALRRRLSIAAGGTLLLMVLYALARAYDATAWFRVSLIALSEGVAPPALAGGASVIDAFGAVLSVAALVVVPALLALSVYPGLLLPEDACVPPAGLSRSRRS